MEMIRGARRILKTQTKEDIEEVERVREERRTKRRNDPLSSESEAGEFEIGVNIPHEENDDSQVKKRVKRSIKRLRRVSMRAMRMCPWKRRSQVKKRMSSPYVELVLKNMHLAKLFSYHMESYKELTCEFLASMRYHMYEEEDRADLDQGLGWITFLAKGEKRMVTFRQLEILFGFNYGEGTKWNFKEKELQRVWATIADGVYSSSRSKAAQIRSPVLRYVHKALANTFFARKATGTINEGELKFLDMGIKPLLSRTSDGKRIRGDRSDTGNLMPFLDHLLTYKITAYNTRHQRGRKLSIGGLITPILCAAGELDGRFQFKFTHPLVGPSKLLLPNPELTTVVRGENIDFRPPVYTLVGHEDDCEKRSLSSIELSLELRVELRIELNIRSRSADLGEPECYYFEEYEAPRMNPSVVAAHKRIGLLQRFNKWQGKAMEKMQKSMDKMVSKIKSLEKKVSGSSSKKKSKAPTFPRSRSLLTTQRRLPAQRASQSLFFRAKKERQHAEKEEEFQGQTLQLDHRTRSSPNRGNSTRSS
ncbi:unnamed protein product [Microthlaspi erraticum]|uniref:Arabidopsis retrotransposon Orf1 C-terminal domain-containing protein n=1 Tax=Microthlaspi erraticum TaxID=1685480 RepID=A0A6D2JNE5_9BRAS|nr:unnamed protein product [Microthlaspi erraticum]